jgi:bifunctional non-homologous end joining protein LigD
MRSTVAAYSLRSYGWPTVSTPVAWQEVEAAAAGEALVFEPAAVLERLERLGDLHAPVLELDQRLPLSRTR